MNIYEKIFFFFIRQRARLVNIKILHVSSSHGNAIPYVVPNKQWHEHHMQVGL